MTSTIHFRQLALAAPLLLALSGVFAAPGDILFSDDFNDNNLAPWSASNNSRAGILTGGQTSGSNPRAGYTRHGAVTVTGPTFNAAVPAARLEIWVRRGSDSLNNSEDTDTNENFVVEYQRSDASWATLGSYLGSGTKGQIYQDAYVLPADALHASLALRVRQTAGSGVDFDYWHFDDVIVTEIAPQVPLDVGVCDDFENGLSNWTVNASGGLAGISSATSASPINSLFLNGGIVNVESNIVDTSNPAFSDLTLWIRRGADSFSENPDGGENFVIEYLDSGNSWVGLETFTGSGQPGQTFNRIYSLPAAARHAGFRLRFRMTGGSGSIYDFWHVDDVCFEAIPLPNLLVTKVARTLSDPVNGTNNPKSIPGAIIEYTILVTNSGPGAADADSVRIFDPIPANPELYVDDTSSDPIRFIDGGTASGLSFVYATDADFSNQPGGSPLGYSPSADADGFDASVTAFSLAPTGSLAPSVGGNNPGFSFVFLVRVR